MAGNCMLHMLTVLNFVNLQLCISTCTTKVGTLSYPRTSMHYSI